MREMMHADNRDDFLDRLIALQQHEYWQRLRRLEARQFGDIMGHKQVNDTYLVKLALLYHGRLATFDSGIRPLAAPQNLELIPS
jgi:predicted nucleic acid-binding protein